MTKRARRSFFSLPAGRFPGAEKVCRLPKDPENHVGKPEKLRQEVAQERGGNHRQHNGQNHHRRARAFLFIAEFRAVAQILGNVKSCGGEIRRVGRRFPYGTNAMNQRTDCTAGAKLIPY